MRRPGRGRSAFLAAVLLSVAWPAHAGRVVVPASKDNTLFGPFNGAFSNGAGPSVFCGSTQNFGPRRALLQFTLTDSLPGPVRVDSVRVRLHMDRTTAGAFTLALHRVSQAWGEAGSVSSGGGGALAQPGDATWTHAFYNTVPWSTAGGDFAAAPSAGCLVDSIVRDYFWGSTPELVADVQAWVDDPATNFGWILIGDETVPSAKRFDARESATPEFRPELIIDYSRVSAVRLQTWGETKARYRSGAPAPAAKQVRQ